MWAAYNPSIDSAYVLFADHHPGEQAITLMDVAPGVLNVPPAVRAALETFTLEFDEEGRLVAMEIEHASHVLPRSFLERAQRERGPRP
jgi:uncharacterized protein YuzE